ncbi:Uridine diphosphate-N-acetylglucosamine transporter Hut1 [Taphrina deformans PYCC 5710]|uniref:UDP-galactose transporter homolog 1 n=1 Tax=Taphrina deformans (strain PYCC 5710 / ATCC 11124 / CBS 356.35 / IMI 108563 / JCM 9778 / NBRC 8474) TaxID=1097556 RepID=R4XHI1_TAPDE|nr:Uridine diphosphate-N-acetylglucosamine transporter Hut1 [Taphrina deformans PYCC 5710]|eukprot:CCG85139.1 Uridine diphosphate-N-acetylglucosamine transporter Hut1 [Taphrina deformans PYCC 5710]
MSMSKERQTASTLQLLLCVAAIYTAYLSWAVLQERIATTPYGNDKRIFRASFVLNTAQSLAASLTGTIYLLIKGRGIAQKSFLARLYPSRDVLFKFVLIAITSSLASPFGYASLKYIDYPTQILGKSCKLLPVMALGVIVYGRRFPPHKYLVVAMVTTGVAMFTLFNGKSRSSSKSSGGSSWWGLSLLSVNLLLDGLTNSTQDQMFKQFSEISGPSMMVGLNLMSSLLVSMYLASGATTELPEAVSFMKAHPKVVQDILAFAFCGAMGQLAIFYTLEKFGSLVLVTVTLTRKMFTMLLSVVWFNHPLSLGQYAGVALVFGGISAEALFKSQDSAKSKRDIGPLAQNTRSKTK